MVVVDGLREREAASTGGSGHGAKLALLNGYPRSGTEGNAPGCM
jgi:hypothetical protein